MGRILSVDYGRKRTGLAVSDPLGIIAGALDTVPTHTLMDFLKRYVPQNGVDTIVVGMPRQMDGSPSESYAYIRPFVRRLAEEMPQVKVTSRMAMQAIIAGGVPKGRRREDKGLVDRVSAAIILQGYLDSKGSL